MRQNSKQYDLEDRTFAFAKSVRAFVKESKKSLSNIEDGKQLVRASGSVGANYIEANEALSKKDVILRIKIIFSLYSDRDCFCQFSYGLIVKDIYQTALF